MEELTYEALRMFHADALDEIQDLKRKISRMEYDIEELTDFILDHHDEDRWLYDIRKEYDLATDDEREEFECIYDHASDAFKEYMEERDY